MTARPGHSSVAAGANATLPHPGHANLGQLPARLQSAAGFDPAIDHRRPQRRRSHERRSRSRSALAIIRRQNRGRVDKLSRCVHESDHALAQACRLGVRAHQRRMAQRSPGDAHLAAMQAFVPNQQFEHRRVVGQKRRSARGASACPNLLRSSYRARANSACRRSRNNSQRFFGRRIDRRIADRLASHAE